MTLSALDWIASLVERSTATGDTAANVQFHSYPFLQSEFVWIREHQANIEKKYIFNGRTFIQFANFVKHEQPWIGAPSLSEKTNLYDIVDPMGNKYVYDVLIKVFKEAEHVIKRLAAQFSENTPVYPCF